MREELDLEDMLIYPAFLIAQLLNVGIIPDVQLFGFSAASVVWSSGGTTITWALIIAVLTLVAVFATNQPDLSAYDRVQTGIVVGTIALILTPPFIPIIDQVLDADIAKVAAFMVQSSGYFSLSYLG